MMSRPGYTLIEILITSAIFAIVALLATATISSTLQLQLVSRQGHEVVSQEELALQEVSREVQQATNVQVVHLAGTPLSTYPWDDLLLITVLPHDESGQLLSQAPLRQEVICAEPQLSSSGAVLGKRLARYVLSGTGYTLASGVGPSFQCTSASIHNHLTPKPMPPKPLYLAASEFDTLNFRVWPVWSQWQSGANPPWDQNPLGWKLGVTAEYNPDTVSQFIEQRASNVNTVAPQVVIQAMVPRNSAITTTTSFTVTGN